LIRAQHTENRRWTFQLLYDNIKVLAKSRDDIGSMPSYPTFVRFMHAHGLKRVRGRRGPLRPGEQAAIERKERREVRSYEVAYVHALWHTDFHVAKRSLVGANGEFFAPRLLCVIDDCSRLVCHAQWYSRPECAEDLVHGLSQALQKRGLPRALMSDKGSAMLAGECSAGLLALGISHDPTAAYSPHQNGKQEVFWNQVEGRLLPMLDGSADLTLEQLNHATQAWVEMEYQRRAHSELGMAPLTRYTQAGNVGRPCPGSDRLRQVFTIRLTRRVRGSDGTVSLDGTRFELPTRLRTLQQVTLRYARWDLRRVWVIDPATDVVITPIYPLDKQANADRQRRCIEPPSLAPEPAGEGGMAPLMQELMREYAATGLPPAYVPTPVEVQQ
jgi:transposase InsO family protein